jgi:hypothetical protein
MMQTAPFDLTTFPWARAQKTIGKQATPPWLYYGMLAMFFITCAGLGLSISIPPLGKLLGTFTPVYICVVGFGITLLLLKQQSVLLQGFLNTSAMRAGPWHAEITDEGLLMRGAGAQTLFSWGYVTEVRDDKAGLFVMLGPGSFVPIAHNAFVSEADRAAFRQAVEARIGATGEPNDRT